VCLIQAACLRALQIDYMKGMAPPQRKAFVDINDEDFEDPELAAARKAYDNIDVFKRH
jgi:hypothetical protein